MAGRDNGVNYDEDLDHIDFDNYKGMFFGDEPGQKFQDEVTGAHFEYHDMCKRLQRLQKELIGAIHTIESREDADPGVDTVCDKSGPKKDVKPPNVRALQVLQELLTRGKSQDKTKESRNAAQGLPQQGYGTTGAFGKEVNGRASYIDCRNFRQFSSQLGPQPPAEGSHPVHVGMQGSNRSKSTEKQRPLVRAVGMPLVKPSGFPHNTKKKSYLNLYENNIMVMMRIDKRT